MRALAVDGGTPVRATMLDHRRGAAAIGAAERAAVLEVLDSQALFRYGATSLGKVAAFEADVAAQVGVPHALATSSGTAALQAALAALGVGPGDEVVLPAVTFVATANAVVTAGAVPVFCDLDDSLGLDAAHLATVVNERTAAVLPVHLENVVCDMDAILAVTTARGIPVVEDACQAMGATYRGRAAGTIGDVGCFSLQLEKNITAGEGGVVVTSDPVLHLRAARYTDQGGQFVTGRGAVRGGEVDEPFVGENLRMTELAGAIAGVQLQRLPALLASMRANKAKVVAGTADVAGLLLRSAPDPDGDGGSSCLWFLPTAELSERFASALLAEGIPSARLYDGKPLYLHPAYQARRTVTPKRSPWAGHRVDVSYPIGTCPRAEDLAARTVGVAISPGYTAADVDDVIEAVRKVADALL
jgi:8-amino-3,8-dideoxy-alpha-D-manno-octulosonate transaminase